MIRIFFVFCLLIFSGKSWALDQLCSFDCDPQKNYCSCDYEATCKCNEVADESHPTGNPGGEQCGRKIDQSTGQEERAQNGVPYMHCCLAGAKCYLHPDNRRNGICCPSDAIPGVQKVCVKNKDTQEWELKRQALADWALVCDPPIKCCGKTAITARDRGCCIDEAVEDANGNPTGEIEYTWIPVAKPMGPAEIKANKKACCEKRISKSKNCKKCDDEGNVESVCSNDGDCWDSTADPDNPTDNGTTCKAGCCVPRCGEDEKKNNWCNKDQGIDCADEYDKCDGGCCTPICSADETRCKTDGDCPPQEKCGIEEGNRSGCCVPRCPEGELYCDDTGCY